MRPIRFGTDGWRGVIADDFTYQRAAVVCAAIGEYLEAEGRAGQGMAIGYDTRFASREIAMLATSILTQRGIPVRLAATSAPTPVVSYTITRARLGGAVMVTASHNPSKYNGIKFKPWFGGPAPEQATMTIEERANALLPAFDADDALRRGPQAAWLTQEDFIPPYLEHIRTQIDVKAVGAMRPRLIVDPLYGAASGVLDRALQEIGCRLQVLHGEYNPGFGGINPDPTEQQLEELMKSVRHTRVEGAVAADGDGDRLGAVAETGEYISSHHLFALLLMHLVEDRELRGGVVKTVSTSTMIGQLAARYGLPLYETPVGFRNIAQLMLEDDILIGGEENGGIGVRGHIPERDATLAALLLVEMMAHRHTTLGGLLAQLRERVGDHAIRRLDLALPQPPAPAELLALRSRLPRRLAGIPVSGTNERDGLKILLLDGSWVLLRASGTEPMLRIYAESDTAEKVQALLNEGVALLSHGDIRQAA